jgi:SAM-dependent methyltransferase
MLNNPIGVFLYLMLRNDIGWRLLSSDEKRRVMEANRYHNTERHDYAVPSEYGRQRCRGGENWDGWHVRNGDHRYTSLLRLLNRIRPKRVLEVGPGAGFYSRAICECDSVQHYSAIDIGQAFLDYLTPRLTQLQQLKKLEFELVCGDVTRISLRNEYDLVVMFSTVHHIPNRIELFSQLSSCLGDGGRILCCDPSHYLFRWIHLLKHCVKGEFLKKTYYSDPHRMGTHHMCSRGEYEAIVRRVKELKIESIEWVLPRRVKQHERLFVPNYLFSSEIVAVFGRA